MRLEEIEDKQTKRYYEEKLRDIDLLIIWIESREEGYRVEELPQQIMASLILLNMRLKKFLK